MRLLAIECATEACSVALFENGAAVDARHETLGRGHAERLIPMIAELPERGRADEILVSLGPGSFTGTRIGIASGRALGIAWSARVVGYPTLALVAAMAQREVENEPVLVAMAGGHGEYFLQPFDAAGLPEGPHRSLLPEIAAGEHDYRLVAGSRAAALVEQRGFGTAIDILPDAQFANLLPKTLITSDLRPIYGRPPDARLPA
ncbi:tRNA (adenosine(37)-N6)-threonylcarbamoyltransferase complex dimerization subunit type 1 TsaB [Qipengyuania sp. MTN3-11]|uniref:tRNA (adenosine(37)-N6)-threonylcarbamoyltransferase complex dimerization subunit type 1 TsaB n=1 Tax=Qipengyuania sp. MTN3-11 TaxID=3056557 RepID=UPI0036F2714C